MEPKPVATSFSSLINHKISTLGPIFTWKQFEFWKTGFILSILAYSGPRTCQQIWFYPVLRKLDFPPGNDFRA